MMSIDPSASAVSLTASSPSTTAGALAARARLGASTPQERKVATVGEKAMSPIDQLSRSLTERPFSAKVIKAAGRGEPHKARDREQRDTARYLRAVARDYNDSKGRI